MCTRADDRALSNQGTGRETGGESLLAAFSGFLRPGDQLRDALLPYRARLIMACWAAA